MLNSKPERGALVNKRATEAAESDMKMPGDISGGAKSKRQHGKFSKNTIPTERLHVLKRPVQHGLQQDAGVTTCKLEKCSRKSLKLGKSIKEPHSEVRLRPGVNKCSATIECKGGEKLNPSGASLPVVVDDRLDPDAIPEDAHHNQG